jgi:hypothetical protein
MAVIGLVLVGAVFIYSTITKDNLTEEWLPMTLVQSPVSDVNHVPIEPTDSYENRMALYSSPEEKEAALDSFSEEEKEKIVDSASIATSSGIFDPAELGDTFEEIEDLDKLMILCGSAATLDPIRCYRVLAIRKPEHNETICNQITERTCQYYTYEDSCKENLEDIRFDCKYLFPMLG